MNGGAGVADRRRNRRAFLSGRYLLDDGRVERLVVEGPVQDDAKRRDQEDDEEEERRDQAEPPLEIGSAMVMSSETTRIVP